MIPLVFDENFNEDIIRGLLRRNSRIDLVRVQHTGLSGADDPTVLEWAARQGRATVTHDVSTMTYYAYERVAAGKAMPGLFEVPRSVLIAQAIEDLILIAECGVAGEWEGRVVYLPLR